MKTSKSKQAILDFLKERGGQGHVVTGYRYTRQGLLRGTTTPVLCTFAQAFIGMIDHGLVERVDGSRTLFRLRADLLPGKCMRCSKPTARVVSVGHVCEGCAGLVPASDA
jgi:hypothetical protein